MTNPDLTAHYRERQLLNLLILVLFCLLAWSADHYGRMAASGFTDRLAIVMKGARQ